MTTYTFEFQTNFPGVVFQEIGVAFEFPRRARAWIKSSRDEGGRLRLQLDDGDSDAEALNRATLLADHVANVLSISNSAGRWDSWTLDNWSRNRDGHERVSQNLNLKERVDNVVALGAAKREELRTLLAQQHHAGLIYYSQFRSAIGLSDTLSRFIAIYGIVLAILGDVQEKVDEFVLSVESGVATNPPYRQRVSGIPETVYTRPRNQVGHARRGATLEATISEMNLSLSGLVEIARKLIARQPEAAPSI